MKTSSSSWVRRLSRGAAVPAVFSLAMAVSAAVPAFGQSEIATIRPARGGGLWIGSDAGVVLWRRPRRYGPKQ